MRWQEGRAAFTLVELLAVMAIISLLAAMLLPVLSQALETARTTACTNNVRQLGLGMGFYADDYSGLLPWIPRNHPSNLSPGTCWSYQYTRYLKATNILRCPADWKTSAPSGWCVRSYITNFVTDQVKLKQVCPHSPSHDLVHWQDCPNMRIKMTLVAQNKSSHPNPQVVPAMYEQWGGEHRLDGACQEFTDHSGVYAI